MRNSYLIKEGNILITSLLLLWTLNALIVILIRQCLKDSSAESCLISNTHTTAMVFIFRPCLSSSILHRPSFTDILNSSRESTAEQSLSSELETQNQILTKCFLPHTSSCMVSFHGNLTDLQLISESPFLSNPINTFNCRLINTLIADPQIHNINTQ